MLLRKQAAADRLGVSIRQIEAWAAAGLLAYTRLGKRCVRISETEIERFISERSRS